MTPTNTHEPTAADLRNMADTLRREADIFGARGLANVALSKRQKADALDKRIEQYILNMHSAANLEESSARLLIQDGHFPGDPDSQDDITRVMEYAIEQGYGDLPE